MGREGAREGAAPKFFFNRAVIAYAIPMRSFTGVGIMVEVLDLAWVAVIVPPQISPLVTEPSAKTTPITRCFRAPLMHSNIVCKVPHLRLRAGRAWRRPPPLGRLLAPDLYMIFESFQIKACPHLFFPKTVPFTTDASQA